MHPGIGWTHAAPTMVAAFLGSAVEAVEAMTIVLAAGIVRGWRSALAGAAGGLALLAAIVVVAGTAIAAVPVDKLQIVVGSLLLLFGARWLRKAILRAAGLIPLHDEEAEFVHSTTALGAVPPARNQWDAAGMATAFKAVLLEGIEVVVIVVGVGAGGEMLLPASLGAGAACLLVVIAGSLLHRPLARVPENTLKFAVGIIMAAFGLFWFGEGVGIDWPFADMAILGLIALLLVASSVAVRLAKALR